MSTPTLPAALLLAISYAPAPQSAPLPRSEFSAVDIQASPLSSSSPFIPGGELHGKHYQFRGATMLDLISTAYGVDPDKVLGGPPWLAFDRYDIVALLPAPNLPAAPRPMLQTLLAHRFHLVATSATRPFSAYVVRLGNQLKMKPSGGIGDPGCKTDVRPDAGPAPPDATSPVTTFSFVLTLHCRNTTLAGLVDAAPFLLPARHTNRPLVDRTGLKGGWNFDFEFTLAAGAIPTATVAEALDKQLGLILEETTTPLPVVEVESVARKSEPNSPEDLKAFPPLPTAFDAAEIKPSDGSAAIPRDRLHVLATGRAGLIGGDIQNGTVILAGVTLKSLIAQAWNLSTPDSLVGEPHWLNSGRWDLIARVPSGFADAFADFASIRPLLRNFLEEKLQLRMHGEERLETAYVLTALSPKLHPADPNGRTRWFNGVPKGEADPRPGNPPLGTVVNCRNMGMDQFAEILPEIAGSYFRPGSVVNRTGLQGQFDFTIHFLSLGARSGVVSAGVTGVMSIFQAVTELLGLKLDAEQRPAPVLVIDHVEPPLDGAEMSLREPRVAINAVPQALTSPSAQARGPLVWFYLPQHGRYVLSLLPRPELGSAQAGEVRDGMVSFTLGGDQLRLESLGSIAPGDGPYPIYVLHDPAWAPTAQAQSGKLLTGSVSAAELAALNRK